MSNSDELKMTRSSGNVFQDLGIPNAEEHLLKADFAMLINRIIKEKDLSQENAAKILGIDQPKVSNLSRGQLSGFSIDRLIRFLILLNQDIEINVKPHTQSINKDSTKHYSLNYCAL
ncbi:XRE family transcriptional regulator [Legionella longbeachae]|uniref:helix-turn-helix domain-containing protein n=1 Tax=Legionella longbeachae TaxID=450 RepID=UPI000A1C173F|nr:helix-turn-helix transcriptional regulator [Legionella longbeachae]ARM34986.1 XRE family transcriptional regulator [Legionella longbeachae]